MSRVVARDRAGEGDGDLRGIDQPRPRTHADWDTAAVIGVACGAVSQGQEFPPALDGVSEFAQSLLGPAPMGPRLLDGDQRECDR